MIYNSKVYVDKSPIHGWGVFASCEINEGDIIEICPILTLPIQKNEVTPLLIDYRFNWPQGEIWEEQVVCLGFGSLYNHSDNANAYWVSDESNRTFVFKANQKIYRNSEILIYYGDENYWNDGRQTIQVV